MSAPSIAFYKVQYQYNVAKKNKIKSWIRSVIIKENSSLKSLSIIICNDDYLLNLNKTYLKSNHFTEILTFDNSDEEDEIEGDIFISIERVKENASKFKSVVSDELNRVIVHGVLHLLGYGDKSTKDKSSMQEKENYYLNIYI